MQACLQPADKGKVPLASGQRCANKEAELSSRDGLHLSFYPFL